MGDLRETVEVYGFRPLSRGLFFNWDSREVIWLDANVFVPSLGDFFSIGIDERFPTKAGNVFVPSLGDFFSIIMNVMIEVDFEKVFVPSLGDFFSIRYETRKHKEKRTVFVPSLGDFFSIACLRSPSPSALASAFAAGMGESLHQALSFGDEMPIFPVRTGIGGDLQ